MRMPCTNSSAAFNPREVRDLVYEALTGDFGKAVVGLKSLIKDRGVDPIYVTRLIHREVTSTVTNLKYSGVPEAKDNIQHSHAPPRNTEGWG